MARWYHARSWWTQLPARCHRRCASAAASLIAARNGVRPSSSSGLSHRSAERLLQQAAADSSSSLASCHAGSISSGCSTASAASAASRGGSCGTWNMAAASATNCAACSLGAPAAAASPPVDAVSASRSPASRAAAAACRHSATVASDVGHVQQPLLARARIEPVAKLLAEHVIEQERQSRPRGAVELRRVHLAQQRGGPRRVGVVAGVGLVQPFDRVAHRADLQHAIVAPAHAFRGGPSGKLPPMPRLHVDLLLAPADDVALPPAAARHVQVLRLQPGDALVLFDGRGGEWSARVRRIGRQDVSVDVERHVAVERELALRRDAGVRHAGQRAHGRIDREGDRTRRHGAAAARHGTLGAAPGGRARRAPARALAGGRRGGERAERPHPGAARAAGLHAGRLARRSLGLGRALALEHRRRARHRGDGGPARLRWTCSAARRAA